MRNGSENYQKGHEIENHREDIEQLLRLRNVRFYRNVRGQVASFQRVNERFFARKFRFRLIDKARRVGRLDQILIFVIGKISLDELFESLVGIAEKSFIFVKRDCERFYESLFTDVNERRVINGIAERFGVNDRTREIESDVLRERDIRRYAEILAAFVVFCKIFVGINAVFVHFYGRRIGKIEFIVGGKGGYVNAFSVNFRRGENTFLISDRFFFKKIFHVLVGGVHRYHSVAHGRDGINFVEFVLKISVIRPDTREKGDGKRGDKNYGEITFEVALYFADNFDFQNVRFYLYHSISSISFGAGFFSSETILPSLSLITLSAISAIFALCVTMITV